MKHLAFGRKLSRQMYAEGKGRGGGGWEGMEEEWEEEEEEGLERVGGARVKRKGRSEMWCQPLLLSKNIWKSFTQALTHSAAQAQQLHHSVTHIFPRPGEHASREHAANVLPARAKANKHPRIRADQTYVCV